MVERAVISRVCRKARPFASGSPVDTLPLAGRDQGWGAVGPDIGAKRHPIPTSSTQIAPLERFALRDGSEPVEGEVPRGGWGAV
jgi:hypothetical protein